MIRVIFGFLGLLIGVLLAWAGAFHQMEDQQRVAAWVRTPCKVLVWESVIVRSSGDALGYTFNPSLRFEYEFAGKTRRSDVYDETSKREPGLRAFEEEGAGARSGNTFCYVNPDNPAEASYHAAQLWRPWSLILGGGSLAVASLWFLFRTWWPGRSRRREGYGEADRRYRFWGITGLACLLLFVSGHMVVRTGTFDLLREQWLRSKWQEVAAKVEGVGLSETRGSSTRNSHRITHHAHIVYSYEHGGRRWHADHWTLPERTLTAGNSVELEVQLKEHPVGSTLRCWIHPDKPWLTTLDPSFRAGDFLWQLLPLSIFGMAIWLFRAARHG